MDQIYYDEPTRLWLDSKTFEIISQKNNLCNYGIEHFDWNGNPNNDFEIIEREEKNNIQNYNRSILNLFKKRHLLSRNNFNMLNKYSDWLAPTNKEYIVCGLMLSRFLSLKSLPNKVDFLIEQLFFKQMGLSVFHMNGYKATLLVYKFANEDSQIEIWLDKYGVINEINRFNNTNLIEIKIPIDFGGLRYTFMQIFTDYLKINFNKFKADEKIFKFNEKMITLENYYFKTTHQRGNI